MKYTLGQSYKPRAPDKPDLYGLSKSEKKEAKKEYAVAKKEYSEKKEEFSEETKFYKGYATTLTSGGKARKSYSSGFARMETRKVKIL